MKLVGNKQIALIIFSIIGGLLFAGYILYEQRGALEQTEMIALALTAIIGVAIAVFIIKRGNK